MNAAGDFAKMLPGMDFLQGLMRQAGAAAPGLNNWVTPTLDPAELDKRIQDLRTVQFWLEQNVRLLGATIQALEVQRMTLSTLQNLNLPLADLAQALQARVPAPAETPSPVPAPAPMPSLPPSAAAAPASPPAPLVDPMQWWGALTQQFGELTAKALKDGAAVGTAPPPKAKSDAGSTASPGAQAVARTAAKKAAAKRSAGTRARAAAAAPAAAKRRG